MVSETQALYSDREVMRAKLLLMEDFLEYVCFEIFALGGGGG